MTRTLLIKLLTLLTFTLQSLYFLAQKYNDSLVHFSELKFHSEFEKTVINNYVHYQKDTLNLFLAIDPTMTNELAQNYHDLFRSMLEKLSNKKLEQKKVKKKVRLSFNIIHNNYLKKYVDVEFLPVLFEKGQYNCVSSSILYSLIFEKYKIPYKIKVTTGHVYLIANPGPNSIVVETTNPMLSDRENYNDFKRQYVSYLKSLKVISDQELKEKSIDELYEEKINEGTSAGFDNLVGMQYFNKGLNMYDEKEVKEAYSLLQKAYFFYPSKQVSSLMLPTLLKLIGKTKYEKVEDIDYVAQLYRYKEYNVQTISNLFSEIIKYHIQYTDHQSFCDSMFNRLIKQIPGETEKAEISFNYYLQMSRHYKKTDIRKDYIEKAIRIKQNHNEANELFINYIVKQIEDISDYKQKLQKIDDFRTKYDYSFIQILLNELELSAHLNMAYSLFKYNYITEGEEYLEIFEQKTEIPVKTENKDFIRLIETTYRTMAIYYFYRNDKNKANETVQRGLKYVPESRFIQTAVY